jgi:hypothetical protein
MAKVTLCCYALSVGFVAISTCIGYLLALTRMRYAHDLATESKNKSYLHPAYPTFLKPNQITKIYASFNMENLSS